MSGTSFDSKGGGQHIAQGDHSIGQQNNTASQTVTGNGNIFSGTGNVVIQGDVIINPVSRTEQGIPLQRPALAEHFTGRDTELKELLAALQPGKAVTLCGPGGMGKTALAAQAVWTLAPGKEAPALFPDGIIFHSFYGQKDVSLAFAHIVRSYDKEQQDVSFAAAFRLMASKQALLILDGAEEADDLSAVLKLRGACGVLITTRSRKDAQGVRLNIKPLDEQPAAEVFRLYSGVAADDPSVAGICTLLGGWPVALRIAGRYCSSTGESAAGYLRFLTKVPFRRLGSGDHQQENAALLLRRSVEKVSEDAVQVLRLAGTLAFAPISLEPVMGVLGRDDEDYEEDEVRSCDALNELVTYGLLEKLGERWVLSHALVHTYARKELAMSRDALKQLAESYIAFCEAASVYGYAHLDRERAHCLRLIEICLNSRLWQDVKTLVGAIWIYLDRQGYWTDLLTAVGMRLAAARQSIDCKDEGWCLRCLGYTCWRRGENEKALSHLKQSLTIDRELGDRQGEGETLNNMAAVYRQQGEHELALQQYQQSLSIRREIGDQEGEGATLNNIGMLYYVQGDYATALQYLEQCLPFRRKAWDKRGEATTLNNIAVICNEQGDVSKALEHYGQALDICRELGDRAIEAATLWNIGTICEDWGDLAKTEKHISLAVQIAEQIGHPELETCRDGLARVRAARRG